MRFLALAALLAVPAAAEQSLPACADLDKLWRGTYRGILKPRWPEKALACGKADAALTKEEVRDLDLARAAYVLSSTRWTRGGALMFKEPLVAGGGLAAPPNMLRWVGRRLRGGIEYDAASSNAWADAENGILHLTPGDFKVELGADLGAQLIHESRHVGIPAYGHVTCTVPGMSAEPSCDPTIAEDFDGGGSHAIAALWLAWIANRSEWPYAARKSAEKTAEWVLKNRINDVHAADLWACRYLGRNVWNTRAACR